MLKKILVVDDDPAFRAIVVSILQSNGYEVLDADNGSVGRALSNLFSVDLMLTDLKMPNINGVQLSIFVKKKHNIPIILMTGDPRAAGMIKNLDAVGVNAVMTKPFQTNELLNLISIHLIDS